jgi:hypothetical protein
VTFLSALALALAVELPALVITAPPQLQGVAAQIERLDRTRLGAIVRLVGLERGGAPIAVILAPEDSDLARQTPSWIAGFASGAADTIVIFPARSPSYPHDSLEALLHHEVAHILIARAAGDAAVPRWFHEGLALATERSWGFSDRRRLAMAVVGPRRSMAAMSADFDRGEGAASRAYAVSGSFVRDLLQRHGAGLPARLLARLNAGDSFDAAFIAAAGIPLSDAERVFWRDSWWSQVIPFVTSSLVIWIGIMFLAGVAMRRRAQQRAERRRRWEEEEAAYTEPMKSRVAEYFRADTLARDAARTVAERVAQALELGDADVVTFAAARGLTEEDARRQLDRQRQHGRTRSACHESLIG